MRLRPARSLLHTCACADTNTTCVPWILQAMALSQLPVSILEATLFSGIVYFMVGFHVSAASFLIFWGVIATCNLCLSSLFRWV